MVLFRLIRLSGVVILLLLLSASTALADSKAEARRYFSRGIATIESGKTVEGIKLLQTAYDTLPHPNVLFNIGRAYASIGRFSESIKYLKQYLKDSPGDKRRVQGAIKELETRKNLKKLSQDGMQSITKGRYLEGIAYLKRAYAIRPNPDILYNIALAYDEFGDVGTAISEYSRYLASNPKDAPIVERRIQELTAIKRQKDRLRSQSFARRPTQPLRSPQPKKAPTTTPPTPDTAPSSSSDDKSLASRPTTPSNSAPPAPTLPPRQPTQDSRKVVATNDLQTLGEAKGSETYESVVITASKRAQKPLEAPNAVTIISADDIRLSGAQFLPDVLRQVPGFEVLSLSATDYNVGVRGFTNRLARNVLVLVDNQSIYNDALGANFWSTIPVELADIERIEVVRGPGSAVFGANAFTGVINIITKRPQKIDGAEAGVTVGNGNAYSGYAQFGQRRGSVGFRASAGYRQLDKFEIDFNSDLPTTDTPREDETTSLTMIRANALAEYHINPQNGTRAYVGASVVDADHEGFGTGITLNGYLSGPEFRVYGGLDGPLFNLRTLYAHTEKTTLDQSFSVGNDFVDALLSTDVFSIEPILTPSFQLLGQHQVVLGAEYRFKSAQWELLNEDQTENHFAAYLQDDWRITSFLTLVVGGRVDLHPNAGLLGSPRVAAIIKTGARQALRISAGTSFRAPTMGESYFNFRPNAPGSPGTSLAFIGNTDVSPEEIFTVDVGYRLESDFGDFEAVGFVNRSSNLIIFDPPQPVGTTPGSAGDSFLAARAQIGNSSQTFVSVGSELSTRLYLIDGLDIGMSYAFQYIYDEEDGTRFESSPLHKASIFSQLRTKAGFDLGFSANFVSNTQWSELVASPQTTNYIRQNFVIDDAFFAQGRIGYRIFNNQLELYASGTNLFDLGRLRRQEHPFGNFIDARVLFGLTGRL